MHSSKSLLCFAVLLLGGCNAVVRTPYHPPTLTIPDQYVTPTSQKAASRLDDRWWTQFNDPSLNQLVDQVLARNADLALAGITLHKSRLQAGLVADQQGLQVGANGSTGYDINLGNGERSNRGVSFNANVSYVVDLFGKLANQTDVAQWEAQATEQDLQTTAQSIVATTCQLYWKIGYLNQQLSHVQRNIESSRQLAQLVRVQYQNGAVSGLEKTQAEQAIESQRAALSQLKQQRLEARAALATLLHEPLASLQFKEPSTLPSVRLPLIAAGLPAQLLTRRPDLRASELRLRKALAQQDATTASYYPAISLTGSLGSSSTSLVQLLKNPLLVLGANVSLPFLQINDMRRNQAISELDYQAAVIQYRKTWYQALNEVDQALAQRLALAEQLQNQQKTVDLARKTLQLTQVRYRNGAIALKMVIDAQDALRTAELNVINRRYEQYLATVTLMQALGGSALMHIDPR